MLKWIRLKRNPLWNFDPAKAPKEALNFKQVNNPAEVDRTYVLYSVSSIVHLFPDIIAPERGWQIEGSSGKGNENDQGSLEELTYLERLN